MDPLSYAFIFAIGWVASHAFGEKRDEYERSQDAHRDKYMQRLKQKHPNWSNARRARYLQNAARRNTLGHFAYLLRHGWSSTFNDFVHGWNKAKDAHEEWQADRPEKEKKPGLFAMLKAGWQHQMERRPKSTGYYSEPRPELTPNPEPTPDPGPSNGGKSPESSDTSPSSQGTSPAAPDAGAKVLSLAGKATKTPGNTAGSTNRRTAVEFNYDRTRTEMNGISEFATRTLSVLEQILADAIAGENLSRDTETMAHLASLQESLSNTRAHATAVASSMTKHASGQEYANTGHAASTDYLRSN